MSFIAVTRLNGKINYVNSDKICYISNSTYLEGASRIFFEIANVGKIDTYIDAKESPEEIYNLINKKPFFCNKNTIKSAELSLNKSIQNGDRVTLRDVYNAIGLNVPLHYDPVYDEAYWDKDGFHSHL